MWMCAPHAARTAPGGQHAFMAPGNKQVGRAHAAVQVAFLRVCVEQLTQGRKL